MIEEVPGRVDVRAGVGGQLYLGLVGKRAVLHALRKPEELADPVTRIKRRHVRGVPVADIDDSASIVDFSANRYELVCSRNRAVRSFGARYEGVGSGAGYGGDCLRRRVQYEDEDDEGSHSRWFVEDGSEELWESGNELGNMIKVTSTCLAKIFRLPLKKKIN